jgi:hypothetical protein
VTAARAVCGAALFALLLAVPAGGAEGVVVSGTDRASILPPAGVKQFDYQNAGYRLRYVDGVAQIEVDLSPIDSSAPFEPPASPGAGRTAKLAHALTAGSRTRHEAVSRVLLWIAGNVRYELDRGRAQDAEAVLERRTAYCTGFARLAVTLLAEAGIVAREVAGYVVDDLPAGPRSGFHRWIEVLYPDRGWVFSDPLASHGFVAASYLRLGSEKLASVDPGPALLLARDDRSTPIDVLPGAPSWALRVRPNRVDPRRAAALRVALESGAAGEAILEGAGVQRTVSLPRGEGTFLGLEPGVYRLRVVEGERLAAWKEVTFRDRVYAEVRVPAEARMGGAMR